MYVIKYSLLLVLMLPILVGCGQKEYYQAVKEQNITMQLRMENERLIREDKDRQHAKEMVVLVEKLSIATGATENTNDDFMAAMMLMMTQDKNNMANLAYSLTKNDIQLQEIKAPDSIGDTIQKSTGALLGVGAIVAGIMQSNNMTDIATTGMLNAGTHNTATSRGAVNIGDGSAYGSNSQSTTTTTNTTNNSNSNNSGL